jgi:hypothetical protein
MGGVWGPNVSGRRSWGCLLFGRFGGVIPESLLGTASKSEWLSRCVAFAWREAHFSVRAGLSKGEFYTFLLSKLAALHPRGFVALFFFLLTLQHEPNRISTDIQTRAVPSSYCLHTTYSLPKAILYIQTT